jgi:AcrR family transcriptional regulator
MRARQREAAAGAILEAAEEVAAERGLENTSVAAIAERAGVASGTLYNYFPDREALIASWFQWRRDQMVPKIDAAAKAHAHLPFEKWLRAYLEDLFVVFEEKRQYIRVMSTLDQKAIKLKEFKQPAVLVAMFAALEERMRAFAPKRAEEYARILVGMVRGIAHWRCEHGGDMSGDAALIAETFLHGVAAR